MSSWESGLSELNMCTSYSKMSSNCVHVCMHIDFYNFFLWIFPLLLSIFMELTFFNYSLSEHFIHISHLFILLYYHLKKYLTLLSRSLNTYSYVNFINYCHFTCHFQICDLFGWGEECRSFSPSYLFLCYHYPITLIYILWSFT